MLPAIIMALGTSYVIDRFVNTTVSENIWNGSYTAENRIRKKVNRTIKIGIRDVIIYIIILLSAAYSLDNFDFSKDAKLSILSFLISILSFKTLLDILKNIPDIFSYIFKHKLNIKNFLFSKVYPEVYEEVRKEINDLNIFSWIFFKIFGSKSEQKISLEIANRSVRLAWKNVVYKICFYLIILLSYLLVFRIYLFPSILLEQTGISLYEILLYPISYIIELLGYRII